MENIENIEGYLYDVEYEGNEVYLHPQGSGDVAKSSIQYSDYAYTHGGHIFRKAVQRAKELQKELILSRK